jgi:hypothetical protein
MFNSLSGSWQSASFKRLLGDRCHNSLAIRFAESVQIAQQSLPRNVHEGWNDRALAIPFGLHSRAIARGRHTFLIDLPFAKQPTPFVSRCSSFHNSYAYSAS